APRRAHWCWGCSHENTSRGDASPSGPQISAYHRSNRDARSLGAETGHCDAANTSQPRSRQRVELTVGMKEAWPDGSAFDDTQEIKRCIDLHKRSVAWCAAALSQPC